jgi:adenosine kinase
MPFLENVLMAILVCGSLAFDTIMVFQDRFKNHILPEQIHIMNVSFLVTQMRREFGGCAGNIAYNLSLLGESPKIMATVGEDFGLYETRLLALDMDTTHIRKIPETYCAQAFITTDLDDNQITAFHPGAMAFAHENDAGHVSDVTLAIVAPDGPEGMLRHAQRLSETGIPFVFDPGQALPALSAEVLRECIDKASYMAVNDYEFRLVCEKTGLTQAALAKQLNALIITQGAEGSVILEGGNEHRFACVPAARIADPTGCGDAYRAGLLFGLARGLEWGQIGRLASVMGALKIAHKGGQNHKGDLRTIQTAYRQTYGETLAIRYD